MNNINRLIVKSCINSVTTQVICSFRTPATTMELVYHQQQQQ